MNKLNSVAITAEFISHENIQRIQDLLGELACLDLTFFLQDFPKSLEFNTRPYPRVALFPWGLARERSLEKLKNLILEKRLETKNTENIEFSEAEIIQIFSNNIQANHFDLIVLGDKDRDSQNNNFISDCSYSEFFICKNSFNLNYFELDEIKNAVDAFIKSQRNFGI